MGRLEWKPEMVYCRRKSEYRDEREHVRDGLILFKAGTKK